MKCLIFDRGDGVLGLGLMILYGGLNQFSIVWPDRPPERMTEDFLKSNGVKILGESELSPPMDPPLVPAVDPVTPDEPLVASVNETPIVDPPIQQPSTPIAPTVVPESFTEPLAPPTSPASPAVPETVVQSNSTEVASTPIAPDASIPAVETTPPPANPASSPIELV